MRKSMLFGLFALLCGLSASAQIAAVKLNEGSKNKQVKEVIIVYTMHYDIGYTNLAENVLRKYRTTMMDEALHSVKATSHLPAEKQFVWSTPGWPMQYILDNATPARKAGLENAIKNKRFALYSLAFDVETEASDMENLVRNLSLSSSINKKFNLPLPRDAKLSDIPEHSWILPTLFKNAGVDILHIGCNPGSVSPDVPTLFWWEGPDKSRLLTFYWSEYYGSGLMPPKDWKHDTWLALISTHENTGPPRPEEVEKLLQEAKEKLPGVKVRIGRLSDFYDAIMKEKADIPVVRGDMPDTWIHGYMSMPRQVKADKYCQRALYASEALHTQQQWWKMKTDVIKDDVDKATEKMLVFEEHSFGMAMSHGEGAAFSYDDEFVLNRARENYKRIELSWREKGLNMDYAEKKGAMLDDYLMRSLATAVGGDGKRVVVYNSLPWQRSGSVKLFMGIYQKKETVTALKDTRTNKLIPVYNNGNLLQFYAEEIPAMGYTTYIPVFEGETTTTDNGLRVDESQHIIENNFLKIKLDADKGAIVSCIDKKTGKELVDTQSEYKLGEYFHEYFGKDEIRRYNLAYIKPKARNWADDEMCRPVKYSLFTYQQTHAQKGRWVFQKNNDEIAATWFSELSLHSPQHYNITYVIKPQTPIIEMVWNVTNKTADPQPEAGWIALPFKIAEPSFHVARTGGIVDPAKDFVPNTNHDYYFLNTGLAVTDKQGFGIGVNSPDAPAVSLDRPGLLRFSGTFTPKKPAIFINLYNTQWGTNFTEWIEGSWSAKLYVWPIQNYNNEAGLITPMEETRQPLSGFYTEEPAGKLPTTQQGVKLSRKGIVVTSLVGIENTNQYRLRLWEMAGTSGKCDIELPSSGFTKATLVTLRDEPLVGKQPIVIKNDKLTVEINANQPVTLVLE